MDWDFPFIQDIVSRCQCSLTPACLCEGRKAPGSCLVMASLVKPYASRWQFKPWTCDADSCAASFLCLSAWLPNSYHRQEVGLTQQSWLSSVSYCMLNFLAAFPNGVHLFILLALLVDHWKYLRSVWETLTQMNHGLVFLQECSPAVSPGQ